MDDKEQVILANGTVVSLEDSGALKDFHICKITRVGQIITITSPTGGRAMIDGGLLPEVCPYSAEGNINVYYTVRALLNPHGYARTAAFSYVNMECLMDLAWLTGGYVFNKVNGEMTREMWIKSKCGE